MTIPFFNLFKRAKGGLGKQPPAVVIVRPPLVEKPAGERLSKTVMPNSTRTVAPVDPFQFAAGQGKSRDLPASLTPEPAPKDRAISLSLLDLLENLPSALLKPRDSFDVNRNITIKAAEIEKGMAKGQPTALLASIYEQTPDIFLQGVSADDQTEVTLPHAKVMEQFQNLQVRGDQMQDEAVPQLETPFLQVTIEDTKKFGTSLAPLQTSAKPPVKVEPATARSLSKAEPEPVVQQKHAPNVGARKPISLTPNTSPAPAVEASSPRARIPFRLPPNGTGVPATERVPASNGPPVPTPSVTPPPAAPKAAAPVRIPFKMTPPSAALKPKLTLVPGVDPDTIQAPAQPAAPSKPVESAARQESGVVRLRVSVCLRNLPAFQLSGTLPEIPDDVVMELPFSLIEPQLAGGRAAVDPKLFRQAIPEKFRDNFVVDATETPVLLPLQEVLQHLPNSALKMRHDQEHEEAIDHFETPFSHHAKEDQKRFGKAAGNGEPLSREQVAASTEQPKTAEVAKSDVTVEKKSAIPAFKLGEIPVTQLEAQPAVDSAREATVEKSASTPPATTEPKAEEKPASAPPATVEAKSSAKEFVLRASCLPGITGCSISFADGLTMAGNLPPGIGAEGLCAMAPSVLQRIEKHILETNLGSLTSMTLYCAKSPLSFFMQGNICVTVLHTDHNLEQVTQEQLAEMTKELAQVFAQPELTHVDH
ncbi:MAG TPA: hypothetical protein VGM62_18115 [Chthoniobacterales bacterium]|jgi:predicted regulator of Ras-like GTPase activity (Roadblock/LC7/MglB family)